LLEIIELNGNFSLVTFDEMAKTQLVWTFDPYRYFLMLYPSNRLKHGPLFNISTIAVLGDGSRQFPWRPNKSVFEAARLPTLLTLQKKT
jgi:hypothetical protein